VAQCIKADPTFEQGLDSSFRLKRVFRRGYLDIPIGRDKSLGCGIAPLSVPRHYIQASAVEQVNKEIAVARSRQVCIYWLWKHCLLLPTLPGDGQIHIHIGKSCRSRTCLVRIAGPCPAVPFQLVPVQLGRTNVQAYERTSPQIATEARPIRHNRD
jgi:hypothetical protein